MLIKRGATSRMDFFSTVDSATPPKRVWKKEATFFRCFFPIEFNSINAGIISGVKINIDMALSSPAFYLMSPDGPNHVANANFQIEQIILSIPCPELTTQLAISIERDMVKEAVLYQFKRRQLLPFTIAAGQTLYVNDSKNKEAFKTTFIS